MAENPLNRKGPGKAAPRLMLYLVFVAIAALLLMYLYTQRVAEPAASQRTTPAQTNEGS